MAIWYVVKNVIKLGNYQIYPANFSLITNLVTSLATNLVTSLVTNLVTSLVTSLVKPR